MNLKFRKKIDHSKTFMYDIFVDDWTIDVEFNRYASMFARESDREFEESYSIILNGHIVDTSSGEHKKLQKGLFASLCLYGNDSIYDSRGQFGIDEDQRTIGRMSYQRFFEREKKGHFLNASIYIPTKSYETVLAYLTYKGKACISLSGTDLQKTEFRGVLRSDIYYIHFRGENAFDSRIECTPAP